MIKEASRKDRAIEKLASVVHEKTFVDCESILVNNLLQKLDVMKTAAQDKKNRASSINELRNTLAVPVTDVANTTMETDNGRTSQGNGLFTPTLENVTEASRPRRKVVGVCYTEPSLHKKIRRGDVLSGNTQK